MHRKQTWADSSASQWVVQGVVLLVVVLLVVLVVLFRAEG